MSGALQFILAKTTEATQGTPTSHPWLVHVPNHWPTQTQTLTWCYTLRPGESAFLVLAGIIYLLWGLQLYKILVMLNAAVVGAFLGALLGQFAGATMAGAAVGGFLMAAVTWPLMKYAVAVMGAVFGMFAGGALWISLGMPSDLWWAGGLSGMILFGLMSFIIFQGSVATYMSMQGAAMLLLGLMALGAKYPGFMTECREILQKQPLTGPAAVVIPMIFGMIFQQHNATPAKVPSLAKK